MTNPNCCDLLIPVRPQQGVPTSNTVWDLVVIDEAHRLRNVYKPSNVIANTLKHALAEAEAAADCDAAAELAAGTFGLVSFIDEHTFGDLKSFREQFANLNAGQVFETLKARLAADLPPDTAPPGDGVCAITRKRLRWSRSSRRTESEDRLYDLVSDYLQRDNLAGAAGQPAVADDAGAAQAIGSIHLRHRRGARHSIAQATQGEAAQKQEPQAARGRTRRGLRSARRDGRGVGRTTPVEPLCPKRPLRARNRKSPISRQFRDTRHVDHAERQRRALLTRWIRRSHEARRLGAAQKAIIFTESDGPRTICCGFLADSPLRATGIVLFNGINTDERSQSDLRRLAANAHEGTDRVTGSRTADMRSALVDYFREHGQIMIATEAAAEGHQPPILLAGRELRPALESAADRAAHRPLPSLRPEARRGGRQLPQPQQRGRPASFRAALREVQAL